ncbi:MAG: hypothetical protein ABJC12_02760 [Saprospiraceae bacterium]
MNITQTECDHLLGLEKEFEDRISPIPLGPSPIRWTRIINSTQSHDTFLLDFNRGSIEVRRYTFNKRFRQTIILLRYDNEGRHTNPDGVHFSGPHVYLYREGYNDKFAYPPSTIGIGNNDDMDVVLKKILLYCNVVKSPGVESPMY